MYNFDARCAARVSLVISSNEVFLGLWFASSSVIKCRDLEWFSLKIEKKK